LLTRQTDRPSARQPASPPNRPTDHRVCTGGGGGVGPIVWAPHLTAGRVVQLGTGLGETIDSCRRFRHRRGRGTRCDLDIGMLLVDSAQCTIPCLVVRFPPPSFLPTSSSLSPLSPAAPAAAAASASAGSEAAAAIAAATASPWPSSPPWFSLAR